MKYFLICLFTLISFSGFSIQHYEQGYFIDNNNQHTECYILNKDWKDNPRDFQYKTDSASEVFTKASFLNVSEFGIGSQIKYKRAYTNWDTSDLLLSGMSNTPAPIWKEDTLFLRVLLEGAADLYKFTNQSRVLYFYSLGENTPEQLVYKKYLKENAVKENKLYVHQLSDKLKCAETDLSKIKYEQKALEEYFLKYNECKGSKTIIYKTNTKTRFELKLTGGINLSSMYVTDGYVGGTYQFPVKATPTFGAEFEFLFPFNHYKWSMFVAPSYSYYHATTVSEARHNSIESKTDTIDYKAVNIDTGLRYYMLLSDKSKIHISPGVNFYFPSGSSLNAFKISNGLGYIVSAGYTYGRASAEVKYCILQPMHNYPEYRSRFQVFSIVLKFCILK